MVDAKERWEQTPLRRLLTAISDLCQAVIILWIFYWLVTELL